MMRFDEEWISDSQLQMTAKLAGQTNDLPGDVLEIGVHQGRSALPIANAVYPGTLHAVDDWKGKDLAPWHAPRDNHAIFLDNARQGTRGNVVAWRMDWRDWLRLCSVSLRFVHLDGHHTALEVSTQIAAILPRMVAGGVFAGDDYLQPPVAEGVGRRFPGCSVSGNLWWAYV